MNIRENYQKYVFVFTAIAVLSLTACSAGDILEDAVDAVQKQKLEKKDKSQSDIVALTGAKEPQEAAWDQRKRTPAMRARFNSLFVSSVYGEGFPPGDEDPVMWQSSCSGWNCTISNANTDVSRTFAIDGRYPPPDGDDPVLTKHGITTMYSSKVVRGYEYRSYGGWLNHSAFTVGTGRFSESFDDQDFILFSTFRRGLAAGNLTGSMPNARITWRGLMVGTPQTGTDKNHFLQGDAMLTFDPDGGTIDAVFEDIKNLERKTDYSIPTIRFDDVSATSTGIFSSGVSGQRLQGGFYGPGHAEAAGVFESSGIVGAFGARKQ